MSVAGLAEIDEALHAFAAEVGPTGPVVAVGGRTQWDVGGPVAPGTREVRPPTGIVQFDPAEMVVRVRAGTTVAELDATLGAAGQEVALDPPDPERATVGGVLAVGYSGLRRLGHGPVRDTVLGLAWITAEGQIARAGGATVKNVTGYDLCRLLVGSVGTLGLLAEVVLRTRPRPRASRWLVGPADPFAVRAGVAGASSILWDGEQVWLLLEGHPDDIAEQRRRAPAAGLVDADGPPPLPDGGRLSLPPAELRSLPGGSHPRPWIAEIGVGTVHTGRAVPARAPTGRALDLCREIKRRFDPANRLAPGRLPWLDVR